MKKVTLKDVARELGVTVGTVSHALNGRDDISNEMKRRVFETAEKMGYISNFTAASLRSGKTKTIAIIVPDISNPHIANQIKHIEDKLRLYGYSAIIFNTDEEESREKTAIELAYGRAADGILLCPAQKSSKNIELLSRLGTPYLLIGRYFEGIDTDYVCADDFHGGYLAGKYLIEEGKKAPVYIGAFDYIEASEKRFLGMKKAFSECGVEISDCRFLRTSPKSNADAAEKLAQILEYDSIVAFSDILAFEIMAHLGRSEKKAITTVGFDAINLHIPLPIRYASVGMVGGGWAETAADAIIEKINGSSNRTRKLIDVKLFKFNH